MDSSGSDRAAIALHHDVLPRLEDAGLIVPEDDSVALTGLSALEDPVVRDLLADDGARAERLAAQIGALAEPRRRRICLVLAERGAPVSASNVARAVAATEVIDDPATSYADLVDRIHVSLVHEHLPALESVGLIDRRPDDRIEYVGPVDVTRRSGGAAGPRAVSVIG
ncbi:helix-turn-helix domain-containing protein [Halovivax sp.]|uniref:DUF7344 domain-containing protein n=1 Tax=Halovivax sp. TaxID=1935978 RepID=UPI0025C0B55D|nr:helix-turn-helix domain-containing protein [Halovivax sp.]